MITVAILTISDRVSKKNRSDETGPAIKQFLKDYDEYTVLKEDLVSDEYSEIYAKLEDLIRSKVIDLIITNGGTGFSPRDNTPEVTRAICDKLVPGISEKMRFESSKISEFAYLSRAVAGIKDRTLIVNLPGSPKAAIENLTSIMHILSHGLRVLKSQVVDCASEINKKN